MANIFNVDEVELEGKNLIEAAAGTGKTYSIAVMAVRLIVEKDIPVDKILMVTFTEKAVAELQIRVRAFIRTALKIAEGEITPAEKDNFEGGENLYAIIKENGIEAQAKERLQKAIRELDDLQIFTIHGFAHRMLNEFAFATDQSFTRELEQDLSVFNADFSKKAIRDYIYPKTKEELGGLLSIPNFAISPELISDFLNQAEQHKIHTKDSFLELYNELLTSKTPKDRLKELSENPYLENFFELLRDLKDKYKLSEARESENVFSFDDLLHDLCKAAKENQAELVRIFKDKYKALFVDEFQDTDVTQYEIFKNLFQEQIVFYIGDPKQSIYSFRNADIHTYFRCKENIDREKIYTMDTNYRSVSGLVNAVNELFKDENVYKGKNPFYYDASDTGADRGIDFEGHIKSIEKKQTTQLIINGEEQDRRFFLVDYESNEQIANDIHEFLEQGEFQDQKGKATGAKKILPNQIAVLARGKEDLFDLKNRLGAKGIPAVIISEEKIFETSAGDLVFDILRLLQKTEGKEIRKMLLHPVFNLSATELRQKDFSKIIAEFYDFKSNYKEQKTYRILKDIYTTLGLRKLAEENLDNSTQFWANLNQAAEQIQTIVTRDKLSLEEIIARKEQDHLGQDDEYQTRIESDEEAIQLLTIHKSKGLQFDFVFTTNLNLTYRTSVSGFFKYYRDGGYFIDLSMNNIGYYNQLYLDNIIQENRRLAYVALTRAKYGVFAYTKTRISKTGKNTYHGVMDDIWVNGDNGEKEAFVNPENPFSNPGKTKYKIPSATKNKTIQPKINYLNITDKFWTRFSFSALSEYQHFERGEERNENYTDYDQFVFEQLGSGVHIGTLVHKTLEYIDFKESKTWDEVIQKTLDRYHSAKSNDAKFIENYKEFVTQHVLNTEISIGGDAFTLSTIPTEDKLHEMEFNMNVEQFDLYKIREILGEENVHFNENVNKRIHGILNGEIDLVFRRKVNGLDKYYLLDWKTNHLGYSTEDYKDSNLEKAMNVSGYKLQGLIYQYALDKYLQQRLGQNYDYEKNFGGVIYFFVRGARKGESFGVYQPEFYKEDLNNMEKAIQIN